MFPRVTGGQNRLSGVALAAGLVAALSGSGCVMRETVRDSHGNIIYRETVRGTPYESAAERNSRIIEREDQLGY